MVWVGFWVALFYNEKSYPDGSHFVLHSKRQAARKPCELSDGQGLHLLIEPNGSKLWRFRYQFDRKEKMLSLGTYPEIPLASARSKRDDARRLVAEGTDPSQQKARQACRRYRRQQHLRPVAEDHNAQGTKHPPKRAIFFWSPSKGDHQSDDRGEGYGGANRVRRWVGRQCYRP